MRGAASIATLLAALCTTAAVAAQPLPPAEPPGMHSGPPRTADFVILAAQMNTFEVETGQLAAQRALSSAVRTAAARTVREHEAANRALLAAAGREHLPSPGDPGLDLGAQQRLEQLKATTGPAFDRLYVDGQVRAHLQALALMNGYVRDAHHGPLWQAALKVRAMISRHLATFEALQSHAG